MATAASMFEERRLWEAQARENQRKLEALNVPEEYLRSRPRRPEEEKFRRIMNKLVESNLPAIERGLLNGGWSLDLMPREAIRVVGNGQGLLWPEMAEPAPKRFPRGRKRQLGCGYYGCVYATDRPGVVFKATTDEGEMRATMFAEKKARYDQDSAEMLKGLVAPMGPFFELYGQVRHKDFCLRGSRTKVYGYWRRELAEIPGLDLDLLWVWKAAVLGDIPSRGDAIMIGNDQTSYFEASRRYHEGWCYSEQRRGLEAVMRMMAEHLGVAMQAIVANVIPPQMTEGAMAFATVMKHLMFFREEAPQAREVADTLLWFLENGVMVCDGHLGNVNYVREENGLRLVLTDPGMAVAATPEFYEIELERP